MMKCVRQGTTVQGRGTVHRELEIEIIPFVLRVYVFRRIKYFLKPNSRSAKLRDSPPFLQVETTNFTPLQNSPEDGDIMFLRKVGFYL
jgi:hypothetical protein